MGTTTYAERAILARSTAPHSREIPRRDMWSNDPDRVVTSGCTCNLLYGQHTTNCNIYDPDRGTVV